MGRNAVAVPLERVMQTDPQASPAVLLDAALDQVDADEGTPALLLQIWAGARADAALADLVREEVGSMRGRLRTLMTAWCAEHSPDTDPDGLVDVLVGLVMGYAVQRSLAFSGHGQAYRAMGNRLLAGVIGTARATGS